MIQFHAGNEGRTLAVYRLDLQGDGYVQPLHVGCLPLPSLMTFADARCLEGWSEAVTPGAALRFTLIDVTTVPETAAAIRMLHEAACIPAPALKGAAQVTQTRQRHTGSIRCVETGETFASSRELSKMLGCSASAVSKHLRGGITLLHGRTYRRLDT